jgi:hypothetical protein
MVSGLDSGLGPQPLQVAMVQDREAGNEIPSTYVEMYQPYSTSCKAQNANLILARRNWAERHWMYSGH